MMAECMLYQFCILYRYWHHDISMQSCLQSIYCPLRRRLENDNEPKGISWRIAEIEHVGLAGLYTPDHFEILYKYLDREKHNAQHRAWKQVGWACWQYGQLAEERRQGSTVSWSVWTCTGLSGKTAGGMHSTSVLIASA